MSSAIEAERDLLKALLRKYAPRQAYTGNQCPCCRFYGLYSHAADCELAPFLTLVVSRCTHYWVHVDNRCIKDEGHEDGHLFENGQTTP